MAVLEVDVDAAVDAGVHEDDVGGPGVVALHGGGEGGRRRGVCVREGVSLFFELER